jgi:hypothetical protein
VVTEHRRLEHEQQRARAEPHQHCDRVAPQPIVARPALHERGEDDAEPDRDEQREVAVDERRDELVKLVARPVQR